MEIKTVKDLKPGEFFRVTESENGKVYVRGPYDRSLRKYECQEYYNVNSWRYFKADHKVYVGFTF